MKNKLILIGIVLSLSTATLWSCGGSGPGAPGTGGSGDTGIDPQIVSITHSSPVKDFGDVWEPDLIMDVCSGGKNEVWGNDFAHVTFHGVQLNPNASPNGPNNTLYITNYRVTFFKENPSLPTIDSIEAGNQTGIFVEPGLDTGPFTFLVLDAGMKNKIVSDINVINSPPSFPLNYQMKLEMWGQDRFGNNFTVAPIIRLLVIADYNNC